MPKSLASIVHPDELASLVSAEPDKLAAWNKAQLLAALRLIHHFFGSDWYQLVLRRVDQDTPVDSPKYRRYLRASAPVLHPLNTILWTGTSEDLVRILHLGIYLKMLGCDSPECQLHLKLPELRSASFHNAFFELKVAATYVQSGFRVRFLEPRKGFRTPDLELSRESHRAFAECKRRDPMSHEPIETRINGALDRLRDANAQFREANGAGVAWLELEQGLTYSGPELSAYSEAVLEELPLLPNTQCAVLTWESIVDVGDVVALPTDARGIENPTMPPQFPHEKWCNPAFLGASFATSIVDLPFAPPLLPSRTAT